MDEAKATGSYYTPYVLIEFMVDYLKEEEQDFSMVLEPSAGDGRFLSVLENYADKIDAVELVKEKTIELRKKYAREGIKVFHNDFIDFAQKNTVKKYSLIIGNPPYIGKTMLGKEQLENARELCSEEGLTKTVMQNLWLAFVVGAYRLLLEKGTIFYVLPMEFLQVQYAEKLREVLEKKFNTIHIITFERAVFDGIEQDICLVYMTNKEDSEKHILYKTYSCTKDRAPKSINRIQKNKPLQKWSNAILSDEDISLLKKALKLKSRTNVMGEIAPGIVTGGNKYFILTEEQVQKYECEDFVLPIIIKPSMIYEKTLEFDDKVLDTIKNKKKPMFLLDLINVKDELPEKLREYLEWAGEQKIQDIALKKRFKCVNRTPWYGVPIAKCGEVIFFKRYDTVPKLYLNTKMVHTTDVGYHIRFYPGYEADSFVFCFYNSMTLALCEYMGRYYGGGVRELVPSEFKNITVPYKKISADNIKELKQLFKENMPMEDIIRFVNEKTLKDVYSDEEIVRFEKIRLLLLNRRVK